MKIDSVNPAILISSDYNPRKKLEGVAKEQLKTSIERFGVVEPIVVNNASSRQNIVIGGHQRLYVLMEQGAKEVPVFYVTIDDLEKEKELNLRLNRNQGEWDFEKLSSFDVSMLKEIGFSDLEIGKLPIPEEFKEKEVGDDIEVKTQCPKCGYEW